MGALSLFSQAHSFICGTLSFFKDPLSCFQGLLFFSRASLFLRVLSLQEFFFYFEGVSLAFLKGPFSGPSSGPSPFSSTLSSSSFKCLFYFFSGPLSLFSWVLSLQRSPSSFHGCTLFLFTGPLFYLWHPVFFQGPSILLQGSFFLFSRALSLFKGPPSSRILFLF